MGNYIQARNSTQSIEVVQVRLKTIENSRKPTFTGARQYALIKNGELWLTENKKEASSMTELTEFVQRRSLQAMNEAIGRLNDEPRFVEKRNKTFADIQSSFSIISQAYIAKHSGILARFQRILFFFISQYGGTTDSIKKTQEELFKYQRILGRICMDPLFVEALKKVEEEVAKNSAQNELV